MPEGEGHRLTDPEVSRVRDELNALKVVVSASFGTLEERSSNTLELLNQLANRPPPGVPVWVVMCMFVPNTLLAIALIILTLWRIQHGG